MSPNTDFFRFKNSFVYSECLVRVPQNLKAKWMKKKFRLQLQWDQWELQRTSRPIRQRGTSWRLFLHHEFAYAIKIVKECLFFVVYSGPVGSQLIRMKRRRGATQAPPTARIVLPTKEEVRMLVDQLLGKAMDSTVINSKYRILGVTRLIKQMEVR